MGANFPRRCFILTGDSVHFPFLYRTSALSTPHRSSPNFLPASQRPGFQRLCRYSTQPVDEKPPKTPLNGEVSHQPDGESSPRPMSYLSLRGQKPEPPSADNDRPGSTITPTERKIFEQIIKSTAPETVRKLEKIAPLLPPKSPERQKVDPSATSTSRPATDNDDVNDDLSEVSDIMNLSVQKLHERRRTRSTFGEEAQEETAVSDQQFERLPHFRRPDRRQRVSTARLGKVYSKLKRFQESGLDSTAELNDLGGLDPFPLAVLVAEREADKICKELDCAVASGKGDLEVWKICENRIFAMLKHVNPEEAGSYSWVSANASDATNMPGEPEKRPRQTETKQQTRKQRQKTTAKNDNSPLDVPPNVPVFVVIGIVYPRTLLHALRVFHKNFPVSPFSTQLPEAVKSHSRVSRLLGASTEFYNEIIAFRWRYHNDLPRISALLREMEVTGVPFNVGTLRILEDIRLRREEGEAEARKSESNSVGNTWWWDAGTSSKLLDELVGRDERSPSWLTKIQSQIWKESNTRMRRRKYERQVASGTDL
ncbi:hypothetical protein VTO42DRAFT_1036 [Malbranchea cinnamomea]